MAGKGGENCHRAHEAPTPSSRRRSEGKQIPECRPSDREGDNAPVAPAMLMAARGLHLRLPRCAPEPSGIPDGHNKVLPINLPLRPRHNQNNPATHHHVLLVTSSLLISGRRSRLDLRGPSRVPGCEQHAGRISNSAYFKVIRSLTSSDRWK